MIQYHQQWTIFFKINILAAITLEYLPHIIINIEKIDENIFFSSTAVDMRYKHTQYINKRYQLISHGSVMLNKHSTTFILFNRDKMLDS